MPDPSASTGSRSSRRLLTVLACLLGGLGLVLTAAWPATAAPPQGEPTVVRDVAYTDPVPATTKGNLLDLYLPLPQRPGSARPPLLIWTSGSAWFSDTGKEGAATIADEFLPRGYAVAGVSIRSSLQVTFPGQLHDVRAAIRWLREHADEYGYDPDRIAIMGNSSGGWTSAIAATTSGIEQLDGETGVDGTSSAVQAAVPFFPPTDFLRQNDFFSVIDHDAANSPESTLVGCAIQTCPEAVAKANPITYVDGDEPAMRIFHGTADPLLPPDQSVRLYEALVAAGDEATLTIVDGAGHSVPQIIDADGYTVRTVNRGGREDVGRTPAPTWDEIDRFLHVALNRAR